MNNWPGDSPHEDIEACFSPMTSQHWRQVIIAHPSVKAWVQADGALRISVRRQRVPFPRQKMSD